MMITETFTHSFPLLVLYPEIHYRFKLFPFSRYFRRQPEIIADAPIRLEPGTPLPVLLLIKDADRYPVQLENVEIICKNGIQQLNRMVSVPFDHIEDHFWHQIERIELPQSESTVWEVTVKWQVKIRGKSHIFITDNLPGLSHRPLRVVSSGLSLPTAPGWIFGDLHAHTGFTEDQVEFGAPLKSYPELGAAQGLSFAFAADHSYDLDDIPGSYHRTDPNLRRYHLRSDEIEALNKDSQRGFIFLPGYELSVSNSQKRNVHLLLLNQSTFLPGTGDSAERWFHTTCEMDITEALNHLDAQAIAIAAHPQLPPGRLERLLLRRGVWDEADLSDERIWGLQICNGSFDEYFREGLQVWVKGLLAGRRWRIIAGSDAHGNFNRFRQVGYPMLWLSESDRQIFGCVYTGVKLEGERTPENLLKALKLNPLSISNGPFGELRLATSAGEMPSVQITLKSSAEFGTLEGLKVYLGSEGNVSEEVVFERNQIGGYHLDTSVTILQKGSYLRAETWTQEGKACYTNPIYFTDW